MLSREQIAHYHTFGYLMLRQLFTPAAAERIYAIGVDLLGEDFVLDQTGCLRVVPGSHLGANPDLLALLRTRNDDPDFAPFGMRPDEIPSVALEIEPGDVVVFTECVLHGAFGGRPGRHQHAINFFSNPATAEQVAEVRGIHENTRFSVRPTERMMQSDRPRIRRMIARLLGLGFEPLKG
jgi:hypothetical protein